MPVLNLIVQVVAYSVLPLIGVLFLGWDWRQILILYWFENITIGIKAVIGMARSKSTLSDIIPSSPGVELGTTGQVIKIGMIAFFIFHYGTFTAVHGIFVFLLTSGAFSISSSLNHEVTLNIFGLFILWAVSSIVQLLRELSQPPLALSMKKQFTEPYKRIIPLHIAIILGAFAMSILNLPSGSVIVLIALKLFFDIKSFKPRLGVNTHTSSDNVIDL
ncbi:MAG: DUF6498-containing protein [Candidatus Saccharimonadales bacterium]